jgi:hypothetical protein
MAARLTRRRHAVAAFLETRYTAENGKREGSDE